jgi:trimeric autotransporter adhesin
MGSVSGSAAAGRLLRRRYTSGRGMRIQLGSRVGLLACVAAWALGASVPAVAEQLGSAPLGGYVTNGSVLAEASNTTTIFLGGNFTQVGPRTGPAAAITTATAHAVAPVPQVSGGGAEVDAVAPDGTGGWYIGGSFSHVAGVPRSNLAHIRADGSVDPAFDPEPSGKVFALALSGDGARLYVGGAFAQIGGQNIGFLAELNATSGAPAAGFNAHPNNVVLKLVMAPDGQHVYAAGAFSLIGGQSRAFLAELDGASGADVAGFAPAPDASVLALALTPDGAHLYVGGSFSNIGGLSETNLAELDAGTGQAVPSFSPAPDGPVFALAVAPDGSKVYAGGAFFTDGGTGAENLAAIDPSGTLVPGFAGSADKPVFALALAGDRLYVGGDFDMADSAAVPNLAALDPATGALVAAFKPGVNGTVLALAPSGDAATLFTGGAFTSVGATLLGGLAALHASDDTLIPAFDGHLTGFSGATVDALALSADGTRLYAGGDFDEANGVATGNLVALTPSSGARIAAFAPVADGIVRALAISGDNATVYAGGDFDSLGAQSESDLGAVRASDGLALPGFVASVSDSVHALALDQSGSRLFAGGGPLPLFGPTGGFLTSVSPATGAPVAGFAASPDHVVDALALSPGAGLLYAGGAFTTLGGGQADLGVAAVSPATGAPVTSFAPHANGAAFAFSTAPDGSTLYAGGTFTSIGGQRAVHLAALNPASGAALPFNPAPDDVVDALARSADGAQLYAGGAFRGFDSAAQQGFAAFGPGPAATFGSAGGGVGGGASRPPRVRLLELRLPRTRLVHRRARVDTGIAAECPAGGVICVTELRAYRVVRRRVRVHRHRATVVHFVQLQQAVTHTTPNRRGELVFTLSKTGTALLARAKQIDIDLRLSATEGAATPTTFETDLFVKAPHAAKKKAKKKKKTHKPPPKKTKH